ncbi:MAG: hypothetical protein RMY28_009375 [Nostoc sp. ChiSLP01]|nr:hypothetical protein [Nostoc sp. CmiSLP01]MDZ8285235.1 hypothetical protein [Nostoc sp. ChiSLP01]
MGEAKRRKELLGDRYGIPDINAQVKDAWETINICVERSKRDGNDCVICQCCRNHEGYSYDAIAKIQQELKNWNCPLNVPMLIQMLPEGFKTSETKLFDGFVTVWTNDPNSEVWKHLLEQNLND